MLSTTNPRHFKYADRIEFHSRDGVYDDAKLAAVWTRKEGSKDPEGTLKVVDRDHYEKIKAIHNEGTTKLNRPDLSWEATVEKVSQIS